MNISYLRRRVDALVRKYADEIAVHRLRPLALEFCDEMAEAVQAPKPKSPGPFPTGPSSSSTGPRNAESASGPSCIWPTTLRSALKSATCPRSTTSSAHCCPGPSPRDSSPAPYGPFPSPPAQPPPGSRRGPVPSTRSFSPCPKRLERE